MSLKIKLFSTAHNNLQSLESEVNNWLELNSDLEIRDVRTTYSDNHVIITIFYKTLTRSLQKNTTQTQRPVTSFKDNIPYEEPQLINIDNRSKTNQTPAFGDLNAAVDPNSIKPGKFIKNNYSKYTKGNQKVSEEEAFNWD